MATASNSAEGSGGPPPLPPGSPQPGPPASATPPSPAIPPPPLPVGTAAPAPRPVGARPPARPFRSGLIDWAERESGVESAAGPPAIRAALVERLQAETWIPSAALQYAFETLAVGPERLKQVGLEPSTGDYYVAAEKAIRDEIEAFAGEYFQTEPAARSERWRKLVDQSADFPALLSRLRQLRSGLDATLPPVHAEPVMKALAEHVVELFILPSHERAKRRRFPDERFQGFVTRWPAAAARLRQQYPKIAALEPQLIDQLIRFKQLSTRGYASPSVRAAERPSVRISQTALHESVPDEPSRYGRRTPAPSVGVGGISWVSMLFFAGIVIKLIAGLSGGSGPSPGGTSVPPSYGSTYSTTNRYSGSQPWETRTETWKPAPLTPTGRRVLEEVLTQREQESSGRPSDYRFSQAPAPSPGAGAVPPAGDSRYTTTSRYPESAVRFDAPGTWRWDGHSFTNGPSSAAQPGVRRSDNPPLFGLPKDFPNGSRGFGQPPQRNAPWPQSGS